ncbi:hypothetical protein IAU60_004932 [Kwoniella sp. DSM 27419]
MSTPPSARSALPASSPPSARLRRIAPSPVKIPPPGVNGCIGAYDLILTHSAMSDLSTLPFPSQTEYDFAPLDRVRLESPDTQIKALFQHATQSGYSPGTRRYKGTNEYFAWGEGALPLVYDSRGEYGQLVADRRVLDRGVDVPEPCCEAGCATENCVLQARSGTPRKRQKTAQSSCSSCCSSATSSPSTAPFDVPSTPPADYITRRRSGALLLSPKRYLQRYTQVPSPILVTFRTDIFSPQGREMLRREELDARAESTPRLGFVARNEGRALRDNTLTTTRIGIEGVERLSADSCTTFGPGGVSSPDPSKSPQLSTEAVTTDDNDDSWSYTLSAYEQTGKPRKNSFFAAHAIAAVEKCPEVNASTQLQVTLGAQTAFRPSPMDDESHGDARLQLAQDLASPPRASKKSLVREHGIETPMPAPNACRKGDKDRRSHLPLATEKTPLAGSRARQTEQAPLLSTPGTPQHEVDPVEAALRSIDKKMTVQLWADQENCREHRTTLRFIRAIRPAVFRQREQRALAQAAAWCESPTRPESFQQSGCWEFGLPAKERDKWQLHHAALEGLPVLHRLILGTDDKHDFLPRGATLQIRDPGVYVACGSEDRGKFEWKFEYLVQPKISPFTGEAVMNERLVIPLALYVSPGFFAPERAQRTRLLNVFKKTLTPNIVAEKMKPPQVGRPPRHVGVAGEPPSQAISRPHAASEQSNELSVRGRKRAQTQTKSEAAEAVAAATPGSLSAALPATTPQVHTRSVSRTIGAIAKSIAGMTAPPVASPQETSPRAAAANALVQRPKSSSDNGAMDSSTAPKGVHKSGTNAPSLGRGGSRVHPPTVFPTGDAEEMSAANGDGTREDDKDRRGKGRRRAASLFSRTRPFTPPINIVEVHPVPALSPRAGRCVQPVQSHPTSASVLPIPTPDPNHSSVSLPLPRPSSALPPAIPPKSAQRALVQLHPVRCTPQSSSHHPFLRLNAYSHSEQSQLVLPMPCSTAPHQAGTMAAAPPKPSFLPRLTASAATALTRSASTSTRPKGIFSADSERAGQENLPVKFGMRVNGTEAGVAPPRRPMMRKRPSTAEPRLGLR